MRVIKIDENAAEDKSPLFTGGTVTRQTLLPDDMGRYFIMFMVNFSPGARTKFHTHTTDQVIIVTKGTGMVVNDEEEKVVTVGDLIHCPAGEKHWHGATKDSAFSHIAMTTTGSKTDQVEP